MKNININGTPGLAISTNSVKSSAIAVCNRMLISTAWVIRIKESAECIRLRNKMGGTVIYQSITQTCKQIMKNTAGKRVNMSRSCGMSMDAITSHFRRSHLQKRRRDLLKKECPLTKQSISACQSTTCLKISISHRTRLLRGWNL